MTIWIITTGEQLPDIDGENVRLWRSVLLTRELLKRGHQVVRWSSTFDHSKKTHRFQENTVIEVDRNYRISFIKSPGYSTNTSMQRFYDHIVMAKKFAKIIKTEKKPDIILCSLPTIELCNEATKYGEEYNVPVVLDGRDMWPDLFEEAIPKRLKFLGKILLFTLYKNVKKACKNATFLSGISEPYVNWELNYAGRERREFDKSFSHGYISESPKEEDIKLANKFWKEQGIRDQDFNICLFSAMGNVIDIDKVLIAAQKVKTFNIKFVLCGDGVKLEEFKIKASGIKNIIFPGWIDASQIWTLMRLSKIGILPYWDIDNYKMNIPNKPIEYLSAGLPILSSVSGLVKELIEKHECGFFYEDGLELSTQIEMILNNPTLLNNMSKNAQKLFKDKFVASKVYGDMADYLIEIANFQKYE
jgi:glycosyltransferase involved in cell wall biosynthesis